MTTDTDELLETIGSLRLAMRNAIIAERYYACDGPAPCSEAFSCCRHAAVRRLEGKLAATAEYGWGRFYAHEWPGSRCR